MAEGDIVYVDKVGCATTGPGTKISPRCAPSQALLLLTSTRRFVHVRGDVSAFSDALNINGSTASQVGASEIVFVGQGGPILTHSSTTLLVVDGEKKIRMRDMILMGAVSGPDYCVSVNGNSSVVMEDVQVGSCRFAMRSTLGSTVTLTRTTVRETLGGISSSGTLSLEDCQVVGNGAGIRASGEVKVINSTIADNRAMGLYVIGSTQFPARLTLERSTIAGNGLMPPEAEERGGLRLENADFSVTNSFIVQNHPLADGYDGYGIFISGTGTNSQSIFVNNTVSENLSSGIEKVDIRCQTPVTIRNSIVWSGTGTGFAGMCTFENSNVSGPSAAPGTNNLVVDPQFVNPSERNYRIMSGSPMKDKGATQGAPTVDIDGQARPRGAGVDIGADEID